MGEERNPKMYSYVSKTKVKPAHKLSVGLLTGVKGRLQSEGVRTQIEPVVFFATPPCEIVIEIMEGIDYSIIDQIFSAVHRVSSKYEETIHAEIHSIPEMNAMLEESGVIAVTSSEMILCKEDLEIIEAKKVPIILCYSARMFPEGHTPVSVKEFQEKPFLFFDMGSLTKDYLTVLQKVCAASGLDVNFKPTTSREKMIQEVAAGKGYTIGGNLTNEVTSNTLFHTFPLDYQASLCIAYNQKNSLSVRQMAKDLIDIILNIFT